MAASFDDESFNRTIVELKLRFDLVNNLKHQTFNRTIVELKFFEHRGKQHYLLF